MINRVPRSKANTTISADIIVSGAGSTVINGNYYIAGTFTGQNVYTKDFSNPTLSGTGYLIRWSGLSWTILAYSSGTPITDAYYQSTPLFISDIFSVGWIVGSVGTAPAPTVTAG